MSPIFRAAPAAVLLLALEGRVYSQRKADMAFSLTPARGREVPGVTSIAAGTRSLWIG